MGQGRVLVLFSPAIQVYSRYITNNQKSVKLYPCKATQSNEYKGWERAQQLPTE